MTKKKEAPKPAAYNEFRKKFMAYWSKRPMAELVMQCMWKIAKLENFGKKSVRTKTNSKCRA